MSNVVEIGREAQLKRQIAAIVAESSSDLLLKILRISDLVGAPRPPQHVSPIRMGEDVA